MLPSPSTDRVRRAAEVSAGAYRVRVPLPQAAAAQLGAALLIVPLASLVAAPPTAQGDAMIWALVQGIVAARLARGLGMEAWWLPMHALFVPALVWLLAYKLPPYYALGAFCALACVYWGAGATRVPLYLSSRGAALALAGLLPQERNFSFLDLGCGLGGVLACLARARPDGRYHGIESAPLPFLLGWLRAMLGDHDRRVRWGDFRNLDLGRYDVVYAYLSPAAMPGLWDKARREMRAGSLLISNSFGIPGVAPALALATDERGGGRLLVWRL